MIRSTPILAAGFILLAGCTVGPNYAGPPATAPKAATAAGFARGGDAASAGEPSLSRWWEALGDPILDALEVRALAANPTLAAAQARLRQARAGLREEKANRLPKISATGLYAHAHIPGLDLGGSQSSDSGGDQTSELNLYNLGFDSSWEVDLFGGGRRTVEAARANAGAALANLADAQVSLSAEVAETYLNIRARQQRIALVQRAIDKQTQMLSLTRQRFDAGTASRLDIERFAQQLDGARADAIPVGAERDAYLDALATLTGDEPGAHDATLGADGSLPLPPASVAIGDPAAMLRRRPDIRAAERTLAADTAKIGQAKAARFPRLSIMGIVGIGGSRPSDLSNLDDYTALLAPQLSWGLFDFGRSGARIAKAEAVRDEAEAKYRGTVLAALRDAEDSLARFGAGRDAVATRARASASAETTMQLTHQRYDAGTTTLVDLLEAERQQLAAAQALVQAKAELTLDFVAVQKALGLGWSGNDVAEASADGAERPDQAKIK